MTTVNEERKRKEESEKSFIKIKTTQTGKFVLYRMKLIALHKLFYFLHNSRGRKYRRNVNSMPIALDL